MNWIDQCHFGDCRELMPLMPEGIADACITDPPYGDTSLDWDRRCAGWIEPVARVLKPAASIWVFCSMRFAASLFDDMDAHGFRYAQEIVWRKQNGTGFHADRFLRVHEFAIQFYRGAWGGLFKAPQYSNDATARTVRRKTRPMHAGHIDAVHYVSQEGGPRLLQSVIEVPNEHGSALHPTQKPLGILAPPINYSVPVGGIVLDPFMGSGSTGVAARQLGRHFVGCENDPACMEMQRERNRQPGLMLGVA